METLSPKKFSQLKIPSLSDPGEDLKALIATYNEKFMAGFKANDMKGLADMYTEDCKIMPTGMETMIGREGPVQVFSDMWDNGVRAIDMVIDEVGAMGSDFIYERSAYTMFAEDGKVVDAGNPDRENVVNMRGVTVLLLVYVTGVRCIFHAVFVGFNTERISRPTGNEPS
uniref:SnoaL-like domain-containing protein n=1 Tax=Branchiostoma floridae TaxID=7739 RepID=C3YJ79_BRAFL|eukprot:XP_002603627.1 hypothetical protein BRAFLDRAFT_101357 [Branchiostoma floridae]